jgi:hypothetical protein
MAGTATLGISSPHVLSINNNSIITQAGVSVFGPELSVSSPVALAITERFAYTIRLPERGVFKLYVGAMRTGDSLFLRNMDGEQLATFTLPAATPYTFLGDTTVIGRDFIMDHLLNANLAVNVRVAAGRYGLSSMTTLQTYVLNGVFQNLLTSMGVGESFTTTSTGLVIVLNRTFTAGEVLPIYRFTSVSSGSLTVTSSNTSIIAGLLVPMSFGESQDLGDTVQVLTTATLPTPVTLTIAIVGVGVEVPLNTSGYVL